MKDADNQGFDPALPDQERDISTAAERGRHGDEPDVLLDVSELRVDEISLEVDDLHARVSLDANVLELLKLHVGVDAELGRVHLTIKGVEAKVLLKVRLDNVARILDRVLTTIDNNPDIIEHLTTPIGEATREVATGVGESVGELGTGAGAAVGDVGEKADDVADGERVQRPKVRKASRQPRERAAGERRRRTSADSPKERPAKGPRTSRPRRSKER